MTNYAFTATHPKLIATILGEEQSPEIGLEGAQMLLLQGIVEGTQLFCTSGTLWITQEGDPDDHLLPAGQSLPFFRQGKVLVQGLPKGKIHLSPPKSMGAGNQSSAKSVTIQVKY